jgi:predicted Fe-Mo cluster-binding NifX family protein
MKAAISAMGPELESPVDPRFGRCAYIIFYDTDTDDWEAMPNANRDASGGAGIRTAQAVVDRGCEAVVTGNIGPNAMQVFAAQMAVYTGFSGTAAEAAQALKEGSLTATSNPNVAGHAGLAGGPGSAANPGTFRGGRGRGGGGGRGMGRW